MHLYNFTLQDGTAINTSILGNFEGTKQQEIIVSRGNVLELYKPDITNSKMHQILSHKIFGVIRSIVPFRLVKGTKDYIIVGTDSGRIIILEYNGERNCFDKVHEETFGKSGCRRIVPGQFLTVDPKGRAVMIGSLEKQKLVYILNRDENARLTISSPLEAHKSKTLIYDICGLDNGYENPIFACLELDYSEADEDHTGEALMESKQNIVLYELDLGLNHVVRKESFELEDLCYKLIAVPMGKDSPGGLICCSENYLTYKNIGEPDSDIRIPIPRRAGCKRESIMIICYAVHKTKSVTFFLLQTEQGDIFKLTFTIDNSDDVISVEGLNLQYIDTVSPATSICILKAGYLFVASEFGNHNLYRIAAVGGEDDPIFSSDSEELPIFSPREMTNLVPVDAMESLCPITDCKIEQLGNDDTPQFYMLSGRGSESKFITLRHGLEVTEMASNSLPGAATALFSVKTSNSEDYHNYIVVAFTNATLVLSIGESIEETTESGFLGTIPTLKACSIGDDAMLQIYPSGIRHIRSEKRINMWKSPSQIVHCATNSRQVLVSLVNNEILYFELDAFGQLNEFTERLTMTDSIACMTVGPVPDRRQRCRFMAVGLDDNTVRIISLDPEDCLQSLAMQALPAKASSLCIIKTEGIDATDGVLLLYIGLQNGVLLRTIIDPVTGSLDDTRTRYLGAAPVQLHSVTIQGSEAVLALSSRSWLSYSYQGRILLTPLSYDALSYVSSFSSEFCPEGIVAIADKSLRIIYTEKLGISFNQTSASLQHTARKFTIHPQSNLMLILEADYNYIDQNDYNNKARMDEDEEITPKWGSCIRVFDPSTNKTLDCYKLADNEFPASITTLQFHEKGEEVYVLVGIGKDMGLSAKKCTSGQILTFRMVEEGRKLELVHKTDIDGCPGAMSSFQGRVAVGVGRLLRIYDMGKRKLLRKCENKNIPNYIVHIMTLGNRLYVADVQESFHFVKYNPEQNRMIIYADDTTPRWIVTGCLVDYNTVAGADKFGNVFLLRLPADAKDDVEDDPSGAKVVWQRGLLSGAPQKLECLVNYYVGEMIVSLQKITLVAGGGECIVYTTIRGTIGVLAPFSVREDIDFFQILEMMMQQKYPPLCGRDHLSYRSYYFPRKNVVDGDLCEQFNTLPLNLRNEIGEETSRTDQEVAKKLEGMRARFAF